MDVDGLLASYIALRIVLCSEATNFTRETS